MPSRSSHQIRRPSSISSYRGQQRRLIQNEAPSEWQWYSIDCIACECLIDFYICRYIKAVQQTTLDSVPKLIAGFLGYTSDYFNLDLDAISLQLYANPKYIARFVAYLQARGVGLGQVTKHVSLARKVICYYACRHSRCSALFIDWISTC